tara:strand:- start:787 stop:1098 length:312 start_codon:yes stop_codon:yes gene_type:complete
MKSKEKKNQLNIELKEDMSSGVYSNLVVINYSPSEFVFDFISVMPGLPKAKVNSRVILSPQHAKRLLSVLSDNIQNFESKNGKIKDLEVAKLPLSFGGPKAQA